LHEGLGSVTGWRTFPEALAARTGRATFAYSRLGHGWSDPPPSPHTPAFMHEEAATWLPAILAAAGIERAVLVGHSDGGSIAIVFAAGQAARVEALVLEAPHVFVEDISIRCIELMRHRFLTEDLRTRLLARSGVPQLESRVVLAVDRLSDANHSRRERRIWHAATGGGDSVSTRGTRANVDPATYRPFTSSRATRKSDRCHRRIPESV
jgi:pimeloyl-ACP methyl ester carboxylesterase